MRLAVLPAAPLADLVATLAAEGFFPGVPRHLSLAARSADQDLCRRLRCPCCRQQGLAYRPFINGKGRYRVVAGCPACMAAEEV
jgi:hypothetical protein